MTMRSQTAPNQGLTYYAGRVWFTAAGSTLQGGPGAYQRVAQIQRRWRPNNDGGAADPWTRNVKAGDDLHRPIPVKAIVIAVRKGTIFISREAQHRASRW